MRAETKELTNGRKLRCAVSQAWCVMNKKIVLDTKSDVLDGKKRSGKHQNSQQIGRVFQTVKKQCLNFCFRTFYSLKNPFWAEPRRLFVFDTKRACLMISSSACLTNFGRHTKEKSTHKKCTETIVLRSNGVQQLLVFSETSLKFSLATHVLFDITSTIAKCSIDSGLSINCSCRCIAPNCLPFLYDVCSFITLRHQIKLRLFAKVDPANHTRPILRAAAARRSGLNLDASIPK